jgi:predicted DNA-binding protein with PD1-like motif
VQAQKTPFGFMVVLDPGDELIRSLTALARQEDIDGASIVGAGRVRELDLGVYDPLASDHNRKTFQDHFEMCSLTGSLALLDGEPFPQLHGVFSRTDFSIIGGLIFEAVCAESIEVAVYTLPTPLFRKLESRA